MTWQERYDADKEVAALDTLIDSEWFTEELENANYHSLYGHFGFLKELRDIRHDELEKERERMSDEVKRKLDPGVPKSEKIRLAMKGGAL